MAVSKGTTFKWRFLGTGKTHGIFYKTLPFYKTLGMHLHIYIQKIPFSTNFINCAIFEMKSILIISFMCWLFAFCVSTLVHFFHLPGGRDLKKKISGVSYPKGGSTVAHPRNITLPALRLRTGRVQSTNSYEQIVIFH